MRIKCLVTILVLAAGCMTGCTGAKGDMGPSGPMGPSGASGSPIYAYNQTFDGSYTLSSEWTMNNNGSTGSISIDTSNYVSGGASMKIQGGVGVNGVVYTNAGVVPYSASNGNYTVDFYWNPAGIVDASVRVDAVLVNGGTVLADLGFAFGSPNVFYTYSGGVQHTLESVSSTPYFHHVQMVYHPSTTLADYYDDGTLIGQGLNVGRITSVSGPSGSWGGFLFPASFGTTPDVCYVDNYQVYHY